MSAKVGKRRYEMYMLVHTSFAMDGMGAAKMLVWALDLSAGW